VIGIDAVNTFSRPNVLRASAITTLALLLIGIATGCSENQPVKKPVVAQQFPSSEAYNATTDFLRGSTVTTRLKSGRIVRYADQDSAWAFELNVDFFDSTGAHTSNLVADSALVREAKKRLEVFGHVHITTEQGTTLDSPHLAWSDSTETISTDSLVVVKRGDDVMSGYGFRSDPQLSRIVFRRQVSGQIANPEELEEEKK